MLSRITLSIEEKLARTVGGNPKLKEHESGLQASQKEQGIGWC